jgi:hypothetical protein
MLSVIATLGFNVTGNVAPEIVKPAPVKAAALMVTGPVPVDVRVNAWPNCEFTATSPNVTMLVLMLSVPVPALNCNAKAIETPFAPADSVAVCAELNGEIAAVNPALVAPAATVTTAGTVTNVLLLDRLTI